MEQFILNRPFSSGKLAYPGIHAIGIGLQQIHGFLRFLPTDQVVFGSEYHAPAAGHSVEP